MRANSRKNGVSPDRAHRCETRQGPLQTVAGSEWPRSRGQEALYGIEGAHS
jgi:hypothetical protein